MRGPACGQARRRVGSGHARSGGQRRGGFAGGRLRRDGRRRHRARPGWSAGSASPRLVGIGGRPMARPHGAVLEARRTARIEIRCRSRVGPAWRRGPASPAAIGQSNSDRRGPRRRAAPTARRPPARSGRLCRARDRPWRVPRARRWSSASGGIAARGRAAVAEEDAIARSGHGASWPSSSQGRRLAGPARSRGTIGQRSSGRFARARATTARSSSGRPDRSGGW